MASKETTEGRLREALQRLVERRPVRVKLKGRLTLNKINNEAGLGNSYIHKFEDFVKKEALPAIDKYNSNYDPLKAQLLEAGSEITEVERLKVKLKKEIALKEQYRRERDDLKVINKELETQNSSLMFRVYELQDQVRKDYKVSPSR
ncbi:MULTISPECIES: hypothetical protein [unclassified Arsukibacterium]|uniref:hypothetical protein n=1 Tax=unclassified Arsukibacterium TaxID=2635278 RepID=UPI000C5B4EF5|nr:MULTISPECIES: hypothetical protein [unclassified Arsukibacterium]MAA93802.1 hypothetical protein [Rheinheimera sp.]MBM33030.1 hypothetical protein [Rheinheimera sp.]HAW92972.1 hypothetical protein [Candidatus Azambacteria bacterium]|tara:strand:+ start:620 stop:1060 length:441 start_codon:yes stop_codon:yes gene_type:complete